MSIAFVDLDKTLIERNSAKLWIKRELHLGNLSKWTAIKGGLWVLLYEMGFGQIEDVIDQAVATLAGVRESEIRQRTHSFWSEEIECLARAGAQKAIDDLHERGERVVLLTSSSLYLSEKAAAHFGLDDILCNRFVVDDGRFTGAVVRPLCYGAGKVVHAKRYADERGVNLADCAFYTDSYSDHPLLCEVGRPVCVDPDQRLRRMAARQGWPIEFWR